MKLQQLGANASDIEAELNEDRIFKNDIDLDGQPQQFGNDNNDNENNQIDYNLYKSIFGKSKKLTKYIDANIMIDEEPPEGHEWKTLPNGEHVLINSESGEIVSGIDGAKPQPKKTENKSNSSNTKTISKKEYLSNKKAIQYRKDLIEFHKRELENIHPNDKLNRKIKEDEIAELENAEDYQKWIKENEEYEKENPKTNAEKDRQSARSGENNTKEKPKKITKNYSISYDDETIEKLNKLGKNWKDKRIYFKDLNNSYYDLENEKWVCDKPETTEKALMIAGETETEKTARLEAEKQEAEKQEAEKRQAKEKAEKERKEYLREYNKKTMNRIYNEDDNYISNKFYKEVGKAMYQNGIFEEGYIPSGSINKIKSQLFTNEEIKNWDELYENSINDIVYKAVKSNLEDINDMYKPMKWGDWLWQEKDLNNGSQSVNDLEDLTDEDPDLIREELNEKYIKNNVAWEKFGEEFNKYKENYKKEAKEKIKEYIKKNYADSKIDTKIKIDSADYKSEAEIDNDIEYYIDNFINYVDAKKEFDESKIKRDKDGRFAKKNENKDNKDNDKIKDTDNDNGNSNDNINNKDNDSSKPKKSNCNIGDVIDIIFNTSRGQTTPAKKIKDSQDYELYEQNTEVFNKLKPQQQKAIEDAIDNVSKRYNELFNIYGLSDSQPTNKLKVVLLDEKYKKQLKEITGFVLNKGSKDENANNIFINTAKIKRLSQENISKFIMHETIHTIMNDNLRNRKFKKGASTILEEALAESSTFLTDGENYRAVDKNWTTEEKTRWLLKNEYNFTSNLMHYFYLKNNKNSDIFKDIVNNIQNNERGRFDQAIEDTGHKLGIEGEFNNIIEYWLQDEYKIDERIAKQFTTDLIFKIMKWGARI